MGWNLIQPVFTNPPNFSAFKTDQKQSGLGQIGHLHDHSYRLANKTLFNVTGGDK